MIRSRVKVTKNLLKRLDQSAAAVCAILMMTAFIIAIFAYFFGIENL